MFWKEIYTKKIVKRRKDAICKYCKKQINKGEDAIILNLTFGHELPNHHIDDNGNTIVDMDFDIHYEGIVGIYHLDCADKYISQQDDGNHEIIVK